MFLCSQQWAKMAQWIEVMFGVEMHGDPRNIVLYGGRDPLMDKGVGRQFNVAFT